MGFTKAKSNEQIDFLRSQIRLPNATVSNLTLNEVKTAQPILEMRYNVSASPYGTNTGNRYFVPLNVFRINKFQLKKNNRENDIYMADGWKDVDHIKINLPDDVTVEVLPPPVFIETPFGYFRSIALHEKNTIDIQQEFLLIGGKWKVEDYTELYNFIQAVFSGYNNNIVLKKD